MDEKILIKYQIEIKNIMINSGYVPGKINNGLKEADKNKYVLCKNPFNDNIIVCVNVDICCIDNIFHMKSAWILTDFDIIKILSNEILFIKIDGVDIILKTKEKNITQYTNKNKFDYRQMGNFHCAKINNEKNEIFKSCKNNVWYWTVSAHGFTKRFNIKKYGKSAKEFALYEKKRLDLEYGAKN